MLELFFSGSIARVGLILVFLGANLAAFASYQPTGATNPETITGTASGYRDGEVVAFEAVGSSAHTQLLALA
jgi:hypothetical protein